MKRRLTITAGTAMATALAILVGPSSARAQEAVIADVPFDFVVGSSRLPAGHYVISERDNPGVMSIANTTGRVFKFVLTIPDSINETVSQPELVFKQFSGERFLSRIVMERGEGREIPLSAATMAEQVDHVTAESEKGYGRFLTMRPGEW